MADGKSKRDLPYGHFGRAGYHPDDEHWRFERALSAHASITSFGRRPVNGEEQASHVLNRKPHRKRHQRQFDELVQLNPELFHVAPVVFPLLRISEAIANALGCHDHCTGSLIQLGSIRSQATHRMASVVVSVKGEGSDRLHIAQVQLQRQKWEDDRETFLEVPVISGDDMTWDAQLGPIQQICLARPTEHGDVLLAVRYLAKTLILRPTYGKTLSNNLSGSRLSTDLLHVINLDGNGNCSHADVTFNPWFPLQLAVVDQAGAWTVLEFTSRRMDRIARSWSGSICQSKQAVLYDGWHRISWVMDPETIVICVRRSVKLFRIGGTDPVIMENVGQVLLDDSEWVLDFQRDLDHLDYCYVLTSNHLTLYEIYSGSFGATTARIKSRIRHFQDPQDLSMSMSIWTDDNDRCVLLHSKRSAINTVYRFALYESHQVLVSEPVEFQTTLNSADILDLRIQNINKIQNPSANQDLRRLYHDEGSRFLSAFILRKDRTVSHSIFLSSANGARAIEEGPHTPLWSAKLGSSTSRLRKEHFVADEEDGSFVPSSVRPQARRARRQKQPMPPEERGRDLENISKVLRQPIQGIQSIDKIVDAASEMIAQGQTSPAASSLHTLRDLATAEVGMTDIQQSSDLLQELGIGEPGSIAAAVDIDSQLETTQRWKLGNVTLPPILGFDNELVNYDIRTAYDYLVSQWITPLPEMRSGWIRLAKVAIARSVAAEVILASKILRTGVSVDQDELSARPASQTTDPTWDLPLRDFSTSQQQAPTSSPWAAKHSVPPTPSPTATPSITTASSHYSSLAAPELYRLSKYTSFSKPSPMVLPRPLTKVLSHWTVGTDPSDYDWLSTSKHITRQQEDEADNDDMTEKERQRARRRAERHIRRQRKEAAASEAQQLASSQGFKVFSATQPTDVKTESQRSNTMGSSQSQGFSASVIASQVVPGRFGGRPPPRKKRKSGF